MDTPFTRHLIPLTFDAAGVWLLVGVSFAVGAAMGSFFNVVAYRLPRSMSLSHPGSRCPSCLRPIRWHDNVPIFGWLLLKGRCRDCKAPISARYPIVELLVALSTALVGWSAIVANTSSGLAGAHALDVPRMASQSVLLWTLFCAALLEFEGHRPGVLMLLAAAAVGALIALVPTDSLTSPTDVDSVERGISESVRGLAGALLLGGLAWPALIDKGEVVPLPSGATRVGELVLAGLFLGLDAVAAMAVLAVAGLLAVRLPGRFWPPAVRFGWAAWLVLATLIWIVVGPPVVASLPIGDDRAATLLAAGAIVAVLAIAARAAQRGPVRN